MKKSMIIVLALAFVLSIAGTAFAATNPFVDVPAKHWSYEYVAKLQKAGIVDGYGDNTFRGDKLMTRYEMAAVTARAMAKSEKASADQKAMIDKLAVEYAQELNNLGVRVSKLEKTSPTMKISADARLRYQENWAVNANGKAANDTERFDYRWRLYFAGDMNDKVAFNGRLAVSNTARDQAATTNNSPTVDYAYWTFKKPVSGIDLKVGRQPDTVGYNLIASPAAGADMIRADFAGKELKGWVGYGDIGAQISATAGPKPSKATNVVMGSLYWDAAKNLQLGASTWQSGTTGYPYQIWSAGGKWMLDKNFTLIGEYAKNQANDSVLNTAAAFNYSALTKKKDAYYAQIQYKGAVASKPGSFGLFVNYKKMGNASVDFSEDSLPIFEGQNDAFAFTNGMKGFGYAANYTFTKNAVLTATYEDLKSYDGSVKRDPYTYIRAEMFF